MNAALAEIRLLEPGLLPVALGAGAVIAAAGFALFRRHGLRTRLAAGALRVLACVMIGLLLARPAQPGEAPRPPQAAEAWVLHLGGPAPTEGVVFAEPPAVFVARLRDAIATGAQPKRVLVAGERREAVPVCHAVAALGMACDTVSSPVPRAEATLAPVLTAPAQLEFGEPLAGVLNGPAGTTLRLDGTEVAVGAEGAFEIPSLATGRHELVAVAPGSPPLRTGRVVHVGPKARLLAVGFTREQLGQLAALLPNFELDVQPGALAPAQLEGAAVVVMALPALAGLDAAGAGALARFVARGGGLLVSGDGAKGVVPDALAQAARECLPVRLVAEAREKPPDPKLEETPGIAEVAKVSVCYVLDRSASMDAPIGTTQTTRWQVAVKGVAESLKQLSIDARAAVMTFTLSQVWEAKPQVFLPFNREQMGKRLATKPGDSEFGELGFNTDIYAAVKAALAEMRNEPSSVKMLIVMTDGADRPGNARDGRLLSKLREEAVAASINIVAIGIGDAFVGDGPDALSARRTIQDLATKPEFAYMPGDAGDALNAHTIFVDSVETAFKAYDDKQKREEEERRRKLEEQMRREQEPPRVDTAPGVFPVTRPAGGELLMGVLPEPAPRLAWYARNLPRADAAMALGVADENLPGSAALALRGYGLGRTAFWAAGVSADSLAELAGWVDLPALLARTVRWLQPREVPELRLVADASPEGIRLLDVNPEAEYLLRRAGGDVALQRSTDWVRGAGPLPEGFGTVIERIGAEERVVGDVFLAPRLAPGAMEAGLPAYNPAGLPKPAVVEQHDESVLLLALVAVLLMLLPLERVVRRRS